MMTRPDDGVRTPRPGGRRAALLIPVIGCLALLGCGAPIPLHPVAGDGPALSATPVRATARPPRTPAPSRAAATPTTRRVTPSVRPTPTPTRRSPTAVAPSPRPTPSRSKPARGATRTPTTRPTSPPTPPPRRRGGTVYLTFDDGPSSYTAAILRTLTATRSTATFFELGINRRYYPHVPATILAQGSNIGNHTYDHHDLTKLSVAKMRVELANGPRSACARPPYGATNAKVRRTLRQLGYRQVLWDVDTLDWTRPGVAAIVARGTTLHLHAGSVILMHDGGGPREQTVAALPAIIAQLQREGFVLRRLPGC